MFENFIYGLEIACEPINLLMALIGAALGTAVGVLPGLGPVATMSILIPITYQLDPTSAIIMLSGIYFGTMYGGSITAILLNVPGEANSVVTCIDGHMMAKNGRAGAALGISAFGSFAGGIFTAIGLIFIAPYVPQITRGFGPPENVMIVLIGLILLSQIGSAGRVRGLIMVGVGLFIATIGRDPITAEPRFTMGLRFLEDGIGIVPLAVGLFGVSELLFLAASRPPVLSDRYPSFRLRDLLPNKIEWRRSIPAIGRGSVLGFLLGLLPGGGMTLVAFTSYLVEKKFSRFRDQLGHGAIEGVAGPETANNAGSQSAFAPMLLLGIPSTATMGVIMGALMIHGVAVGPQLISLHPELFWGVIASMLVANVVLVILNVPLISIFISLLKVPYAVLVPSIVLLVVVGAYTIQSEMSDLWLTMTFGFIGFFLRRSGFDPAPIVLAYVLGGVFERSLRQSMILSDGNLSIFLTRHISAVLASLLLVVVIYPTIAKAFHLLAQRRRKHLTSSS